MVRSQHVGWSYWTGGDQLELFFCGIYQTKRTCGLPGLDRQHHVGVDPIEEAGTNQNAFSESWTNLELNPVLAIQIRIKIIRFLPHDFPNSDPDPN